MSKRHGNQTVILTNPVGIIAGASVVGPKEGEGPLGEFFDQIVQDPLFGADSWEKAESKFVKAAAELAVQKADAAFCDFDYVIAGDLLNQSVGSIFGLRETDVPYLGIFGACSAMGEGLGLGAMLIDGGFARNILCMASSHFCSAEKQFRFPLEFGTQRAPTAGWTVTGAAAIALSSRLTGVCVTAATTGKMVDMGVTDANNLGAAMAGAAAETIAAHLADTGRRADYYDLILTGDLGHVGSELLLALTSKQGLDIAAVHADCGMKIFNQITQDTHAGGSGCACSGVTFAGYYLEQMKRGELNKLLFVPTGALMSQTTVQQGESIPGIAHAVAVETTQGYAGV